MKNTLILSAFLVAVFAACTNTKKSSVILPGENDDKTVQEAFINAKPGDTIRFGEGVFKFRNTVSLEGIENITVIGAGMDKTVFSFAGQTEGAQGVYVKANNFTIQDIGIEDAKGDGIKVQASENVILRRVRTEWLGEPDSTNGAYGLYPVDCKNILMEECVSIGASDAGIYLGQSENGIVRRNRVEKNVAGIEIENTKYADVYENIARNNTGGIMIFDLPDLPKKNGTNIRVYNNEIIGNNHYNFSAMGISVSMVPAGTGLLFMACQNVEAFGNTVKDNNTVALSILSLNTMGKQTNDSLFDKFPSSIYVHDNVIERSKSVPDTSRYFGQMLYKLFGDDLPLALADGEFNPSYFKDGKLIAGKEICVKNNGNLTFYNLGTRSSGMSLFDCEGAVLTPLDLYKENAE